MWSTRNPVLVTEQHALEYTHSVTPNAGWVLPSYRALVHGLMLPQLHGPSTCCAALPPCGRVLLLPPALPRFTGCPLMPPAAASLHRLLPALMDSMTPWTHAASGPNTSCAALPPCVGCCSLNPPSAASVYQLLQSLMPQGTAPSCNECWLVEGGWLQAQEADAGGSDVGQTRSGQVVPATTHTEEHIRKQEEGGKGRGAHQHTSTHKPCQVDSQLRTSRPPPALLPP